MIAFTQSLADAYVRPARNVALPSMPGRQVKFLQGHAVIKDGRDLAAMLRRSEVLIILTDYALSWIDQIEKAAGPVKAEVRRPEPPAPLKPEPEPERPRRGPMWDPNWPRDPVTGRLMKRSAADSSPTDS